MTEFIIKSELEQQLNDYRTMLKNRGVKTFKGDINMTNRIKAKIAYAELIIKELKKII